MIGINNEIKEGSTVSVLLEKLKINGDVIVSAHKAQKLKLE